jgi:SAM-dependent methyltransferase
MTDRPQNVYDDEAFFAGYSRMERFGSGWARALEQPDFLALLPDVGGKRMLDLGCGAGQLAFYLASQGAADVTGIDLSERMLGLARAERSHPNVTYQRQAIEAARFPADRFDVIVSSLAFHYVADYAALVGHLADWLVPGGVLVFSTEHPLYTARLPANGWVVDDRGRRTGWSIDHYSDDGPREERWFIPGVRKYHRQLSTLLNTLIDAGFRIDRVLEPVPDQHWLRDRPDDVDERRRPIFLLIRATRRLS